MNRRDFLGKAAMVGGAAAGGAAAVTGMAVDKGRVLSDRSSEVLSGQMKALEDRFDSLEQRHKNLVRAGAVALTVTTGIDVLTIL